MSLYFNENVKFNTIYAYFAVYPPNESIATPKIYDIRPNNMPLTSKHPYE